MERFGAKRPQQTRNTLPVVIIVCDDTKTAPAYFNELRSQVKQKCSIQIIAAPQHGATASTVIHRANAEIKRLSTRRGATVWAIIDLEMADKSDIRAEALREQAKLGKIKLALSQPCFEIWTLAHLNDTGGRFDSCEGVLREVKKQWKAIYGQQFPQKKAQADYRKLVDRIKSAVSNAKPRNTLNSQSWTEIWKIVEQVLEAAKT